MGSITARKLKSGTTSYVAQIVIKRDGGIAHRENRTFQRKQAAAAWLEKREKELAKPGALERLKAGDPKLSMVIDRYTAESERALGKTKTQVLRSIKEYPLAHKQCSHIGSVDIIDFAKQKLGEGVEPSTVANYMSHLAAVFSIARPAWSYELDQQAMEDAWKVVKKLGLVKKAKERKRRPTLDEMTKLMLYFGDRQTRRSTVVPMQKIVAFAVFSTRRQEEITRITWADLDVEGKRVLVRDMKNPGEKEGNDVWCDLPDEALRVILSMPKLTDQIFPYSTDAIGAAFTRACKMLGLEDLRFHDLRHDGVSRLFEMGRNIPQVACVSGHRDWKSLKRYAHIRQSGDKYAGWEWLAVVTAPIRGLAITKKGDLPRRLRSQRGIPPDQIPLIEPVAEDIPDDPAAMATLN
jgi:integrase